MVSKTSKNTTDPTAAKDHVDPKYTLEGALTKSAALLTSAQLSTLHMLHDMAHVSNGLMVGADDTSKGSQLKKKRSLYDLIMNMLMQMEAKAQFETLNSLSARLDRYIAKTEKLIASGNLGTEEKAQAQELLAKLQSNKDTIVQNRDVLKQGGVVQQDKMESLMDKVKRRVGRVKALDAAVQTAVVETPSISSRFAPVATAAGKAAAAAVGAAAIGTVSFAKWMKSTATTETAPVSDSVVPAGVLARAVPFRTSAVLSERYAPVDMPGDLQKVFRFESDIDPRDFVHQHGNDNAPAPEDGVVA